MVKINFVFVEDINNVFLCIRTKHAKIWLFSKYAYFESELRKIEQAVKLRTDPLDQIQKAEKKENWKAEKLTGRPNK